MPVPWRVLDTGPGHPAWNMAVDEALLDRFDGEMPILRFYRWEPEGLSLGRFQSADIEPPPGAVLVRRLTGGAAIYHRSDELTYSVVAPYGPFGGRGPRQAYHVIHDLWKSTGGEAIVSTDVGQHQMWAAQYYKLDRPRTLITSGGLGTMGFGLPAAVGAKMARPEAEVWAVAGDGGFQMTACELSTIVQEQLDIKIAVINNGYLGMVRQWQEFFHDKRYAATPMLSPDFVALAGAHGIPGHRITERGDVTKKVEEARSTEGPVLLEFRVQKEDLVYPMVPAGGDLHAMIRRPNGTQEEVKA